MKILSKLCLLLVVLVSSVNTVVATQLSGIEQDPDSENHQVTFFVSPHQLFFEQGEILVEKEGIFYIVSSLIKQNDGWLASLDLGALNYCPRGHLICSNCGLCHKPGCWYYVKPCGLWP